MSRTRSRLVHPIDHPLSAVVRPPGSKSITNRALVVASLVGAGSVSHLNGPLDADDTAVMRVGLRQLGVMIDDVDDPWLVLGTGGALTGGVRVDVGASGTTARFLTAVGCLADGPVTIDGTARMRERPLRDLLDAVEGLGAEVVSETGAPPVTIRGPLRPGKTQVSGAVSSQFLSSLLMVAPMLEGPVQIDVTGGLVSSRYVAGTIQVMEAFGASVHTDDATYRVEPTGYVKAHFEVEADASAAVYPAVAVAIAGGRVVITGIPANSIQPDLAILPVLEMMGCMVERGATSIVVEHSGGPLRPIDVDLSDAPDGALAVAVACLFASGPSRLRGLGTLRVKETDRLAALTAELRRVGAGAEVEGDTLVIEPARVRAAEIATYDDHRMAMSFALVGLRSDGIVILDPDCVTKTWPGYFEDLEAWCRS